MKHNKTGEKLKRQLIAIEIIKTTIKKGDVKRAIEIAEKNDISSKRFGEISKECMI